MGHDPVAALVMRARTGDDRAWAGLVDRYAPLIWSICRRYGLDAVDAQDVGQSVWLHLVNHLGRIREPAAIPGWLATTARRECQRVRSTARLNTARLPRAAGQELDRVDVADDLAATVDHLLLAAERHAALRDAVAQLSALDQRLIALLIDDPPVPYAEISARLGIPIGSIGPYRGRCLDKLRHHPAIAALISAEAQTA